MGVKKRVGVQQRLKRMEFPEGRAPHASTASRHPDYRTPAKGKKNYSLFSMELCERICNRMSNGESLLQIAKDPDPTIPEFSTILNWITSPNPKYDQFRVMYDRARKSLLYYWAYEIVDIADNSTNDYMDRELANGRTLRVLDPENVNRSRLRTDTRRWLLSKLMPREFGDKVEHDVSVGGRAGSNVVQVAAVTMTAEEAERAYRDMLRGAIEKK